MKSTILLALLAFGCGDAAQINITKSVGAAGGTVSGSDGTSVIIPMGALTTSSNITIASVNVTAPSGTVLVGPAYDFGPQGTTFAQAVTITLPFDSAKLPSGLTSKDITIYTAPSGTNTFQPLTTTVAGNTVTTATTHLSIYVPAAPISACTPVCGANNDGGCQCTATCNGKHQLTSCFQGSGGKVSCYCEIDNQTQSASPMISSCSDVGSAFAQCFASP